MTIHVELVSSFVKEFDLCDTVRETRVSRHIRWTLVVDVMVVRIANVGHLVGHSELSTFTDFQSQCAKEEVVKASVIINNNVVV